MLGFLTFVLCFCIVSLWRIINIFRVWYRSVNALEKAIETIPESLLGDISTKLIDVVLTSQDRNAVPTQLAKRVIYLWRQDQLATKTGVSTLIDAAIKVDADKTYWILDELGLQKVSASLKSVF